MEGEKARARERTASDQAELDQLRAERREAAAKLPAADSRHVRQDQKKWHGSSVIAEALGGRCSACQMVIRPQHMQDIKRGEALLTCENCGRFLFYNPPVHVEDVAHVG